MKQCYFLGANSQNGFVSLYGGFAAAPGDRLHVIKGGPGTGKSSFMRRIAAQAEKLGLDAQLVLCSGDPASLDGVYLPALRQGWVDGTAPHTLDPAVFGASGDYVNLGRFCRLPLAAADAAEALRLNTAYKALYAQAYACLSAAASLRKGAHDALWRGELREHVEKRLSSLLRRRAPGGGSGRESRRFLSALSCDGVLRLGGEIAQLCPTVCTLEDGFDLAADALRFAAAESARLGFERILCPSPLAPEEPEALLLPDAGLALLRGDWSLEGARRIRLDALVSPEERRALRLPLRRCRQLAQSALDEGLDRLRRAKALHDELEAVYRPYMDFDALSDFCERELARIFA